VNFLVICYDVSESDELRKHHLKSHLDYIETILERIQVAGPIVNNASGKYQSSCFVYTADSKEEALELLHADPYYRAGLYQNCVIEEFKAVAGNWVGGKRW